MTAELIGFDIENLAKLKSAIDGKKNILGCEKTHVRSYFDQVVAIPSRKAFEGLEERYQHELTLFKAEFPLLFFITVPKRIKNTDKIMIIAHSPKK